MNIGQGRSAVSTARPGTTSVRTTIPAFVAKKLGLASGDILEWDLDKTDGQWVATMWKVE